MSQQTTMPLMHDKPNLACPTGIETPVPGVNLGLGGSATHFLCKGYGAICGCVRSDEDVQLRLYFGKQGSEFLAYIPLDVTGATKAEGTGRAFDHRVDAEDYELRIYNNSGSEASVDVLSYLKGLD